MKHLAAIVAIKVVNDGFGGDIKIKDVEFAVPDVYKTDNNGKIVLDDDGNPTKLQDAFPIVGQFQVNMANGQCTAISDNSFASTKFELPSAVSLKKGDALTFYLPVMPFSAKKTISIKVNSSERAISKSVKLESGKVTTFNVPITPLAYETRSDAFSITSVGRETVDEDGSHLTGNPNSRVITTSGDKQNIIVNGESVEAYKLSGTTNTITITGFLPDLIQALPISFYVSTWGNDPAVMTVNKVIAWIPKYPQSRTKTKEEGGFLGIGTTSYYDAVTDFSTISKRAGARSLVAGLALGYDKVTLTADIMKMFGEGVESKITFSNISKNGYFDADFKNSNVVVMNDGFANKEINELNLNSFLTTFKSGQKTATFNGLKKIATASIDDLPTTCSYEEVEKYGAIQSTTLKSSWPPEGLDNEIVNTIDAIFGKISGIDIAGIVTALTEIPTKFDLLHMLRDVKVSIELVTTSAGPTIVFWGLNAHTTEDAQNEE